MTMIMAATAIIIVVIIINIVLFSLRKLFRLYLG